MVDRILYTCDLSNCQQKVDTILFNLKCKTVQWRTPLLNGGKAKIVNVSPCPAHEPWLASYGGPQISYSQAHKPRLRIHCTNLLGKIHADLKQAGPEPLCTAIRLHCLRQRAHGKPHRPRTNVIDWLRLWDVTVTTAAAAPSLLYILKCIAPVQYNEPLPLPVASYSKIPDAIRSIKTVLTVEEQNIIVYMSCKCAAGLVGVLNKANSSRGFIPAKQYQDLPTGGILVTSSGLMEVCILILIEAEFRDNIEKILLMSKVRSRLATITRKVWMLLL